MALQKQVHDVLSPFVRYLSQAIQGARARQQRQRVAWQACPQPTRLRLRPLSAWVEVILPPGGIRIDNWPPGRPFDPTRRLLLTDDTDQARSLVVRDVTDSPGGPILHLDQDDLGPYETASWCGVSSLRLVPNPGLAIPRQVHDQAGAALRVLDAQPQAERRVALLLDGRPAAGPLTCVGATLPCRPIPETYRLSRLVTREAPALDLPVSADALRPDGNGFLLDLPDAPELVRRAARLIMLRGNNGVVFQTERVADRDRDRGFRIQLLLPPDFVDEGADPRAALCDDEPEYLMTHDGPARGERDPDVYPVRRIFTDSYQILLDRQPPEGTLLYPALNTSNLEKQRRTLYRLKDAPLWHHANLLRLCQPRSMPWPDFVPTPPQRWHFLKDNAVDGTQEQRRFVCMALATPDLAILEGPPGSGKTTVICELVLQLIALGQRVLLCSSTHAAVDNVLERLAGRPEVEAVRIGTEDRVDPSVEALVLTRRAEALARAFAAEPTLAGLAEGERRAMAERVVVDAANLTCGTTMGILRHPYLGGRGDREAQARLAAAPHFDVLIIDEASKTQIQEFLVPALACRRWIIIGDVRQLPPFTERADLEHNLADLRDERSGPLLPPARQRARLLLYRLLHHDPRDPHREFRWLLVEPREVINALLKELSRASSALPGTVVVFDSHPWHHEALTPWAFVVSPPLLARGDDAGLYLLAGWLVLVPEDQRDAALPFLPPDLLWPTDEPVPPLLRYRQERLQRHERPLPRPLRERGQVMASTPSQLARHEGTWLREHRFPAEVAWRLQRRHELRRSGNERERERLSAQRQALLPGDPAVQEAVAAIESIALPSILEVLVAGVEGQSSRRRCVLTEGLSDPARSSRWLRLSFQHRMHPEIAELPRGLFYERQALRDASTLIDRDARVGWSFGAPGALAGASPPRLAILAVEGEDRGGVNQAEVHRLCAVVDEFLAWAREHPPQGRPRWEVACLSFYVKQEEAIARALQQRLRQPQHRTRFQAPNVELFCGVVDRFQGREADLVLLSLRNTHRVGFLDSPNRLNVALTRARFQLIVLGHQSYFRTCKINELEALMTQTRPWPVHPVVGTPQPPRSRR